MRHLVVVALGLAFTTLGAASELPSIPNIVPEQTAVCVIVRDLAGLLKDKPTQDTLAKLVESPAIRALFGTQDLRKLADAARFLVSRTGRTPEQWIDDAFGDFVLLAYQPGPPGKPEEESGLFVLKPRRPESLRKLLDQLNAIQVESGEIKPLRQAEANGIAYTVRPTVKGPSEAFAFHDGLFLFSTRETALKQLLVKERPTLDLNEQLTRLGLSGERFAVLLQPRAFDAELAAGAVNAKSDSDRAFTAQLRKVWADLTCVGLTVSFGSTVELRAAAHWRTAEAMAAVGYRSIRPTEPRPALPSQALAAFGAGIEFKPMLAFVRGFLSDDGRKELDALVNDVIGPAVGKDQLPLLLDKLGPNGIVTVEPPANDRELLPHWTVALQLGTTLTEVAALRGPAVQGADFLAQQFRFAYNRTHPDQIRLSRGTAETIDMVTLENEQGFADDWKPSFGVVRGYLVLASDPGILARFDPKPSVTPHPLLLVRAGGWTDYLKPRKAKLAALLARQDGKPEATHLEELTRIGHLLELFDDLRLEWRTTKDTAVLQLRAKLNLSYAK